jgi:hypothetical protein
MAQHDQKPSDPDEYWGPSSLGADLAADLAAVGLPVYFSYRPLAAAVYAVGEFGAAVKLERGTWARIVTEAHDVDPET